ncbi:uncharacterized protein LOC142587383 isoform X3 [Dermacentor variabilis]|uniref:uncharacterized protein LOC142587383 isoform X3 n=1 Tax=Dermacentor variabilis TaxID=34621 RepID=UPI003F5C29A7
MLILKAALLVHVVVAIADSQDEFPEYSDQYEAYSYGNALEVLKASEPVYLFRASSDWNTGFTRCMRSELSRYAGDTTYERTLKYQAQTESGSGKWVEYETKMQLTFKLGTTTQSYIQVKELGSPKRTSCTMWVKKSYLQKPLRHCHFVMLALCKNPAYNAYTYEKKVCGNTT